MLYVQFNNNESEGGNGSKLFDLLQVALMQGLKATELSDIETALDIKAKLKGISNEPESIFCSWCGHVKSLQKGVPNFMRRLKPGIHDLQFENSEARKIQEVLKLQVKDYAQLESWLELTTLFHVK